MKKVVAAAGLVALLAGAAAPPAPRQGRVDAVLQRWDAARRAHRQSHYKVTVTEKIEGSQKQTVSHGEVFVQRPDRVRVVLKDEKGGLETVILVIGAEARLYLFLLKEESVVPLGGKTRFPGAAERCVEAAPRWPLELLE